MERFQRLYYLYKSIETLQSAVCAAKGGIDVDNYSGRYFMADVLEMLVLLGEKEGIDVTAARAELERKKDNITPGVKPIYEMTLEEFERMIGGN